MLKQGSELEELTAAEMITEEAQQQDKLKKEFERSRGQRKHQEQDKFKKEFERSRGPGKHQE